MSDSGHDNGERFQRIAVVTWLVVSCTVFAVMVGVLLLKRQQIGGLGFAAILLLGPLTGYLVSRVVWIGAGLGSRAIVATISGAGNIRRAPSYSLQESLIVRGRFEEAEAAFQAHIALSPDDLDAHLALAALVRDHRGDPERAERLFREARARTPTWAQEYAISNALIDLYRKTGQAGKEMSELARFADRYRNTDGGRRAREALRRFKAESS